MKFKPYVGVAGFMSPTEIMAAIETVPPCSTHNLAIGILASAKTLRGEPNRYPTRYPRVEDIAGLIRPARTMVDDGKLPVEFHVHYAVEDITNIELELGRLRQVVSEAGFDGVQINAPPHWIAHHELQFAIHRLVAERRIRVIMQVRFPREGDPFVDMAAQAIAAVVWSGVTDVLLDGSAGQGLPLNSIWASDMIHTLRARWRSKDTPNFPCGINVAGGLQCTNLGSTVYSLMSVHGLLGFDVESGVRRPTDDKMSISTLQEYLGLAWTMLSAHPTP